jgi:hypothetical protein
VVAALSSTGDVLQPPVVVCAAVNQQLHVLPCLANVEAIVVVAAAGAVVDSVLWH